VRQWVKPIKHGAVLFLGCLFSFAAAASEHESFERLDVPEQYRDAIGSAVSLGFIVFQKDFAASAATDEMATKGLFDDKRLRGWVTDRAGDAWRVVYIGDVSGTMQALYTIDVKEGKVDPQTYQSFENGKVLTTMQQGMWNARQLALSAAPRPCGEGMNAVVLPMNADDGTLQGYFVYLISATTDPDIILMGGHHRMQIARDTERILGTVSFTETCTALDKTQDGPLLVTQKLAPVPEEPHVFLSLLHDRELFVATVENDLIWSIAGLEVAIIPRREKIQD